MNEMSEEGKMKEKLLLAVALFIALMGAMVIHAEGNAAEVSKDNGSNIATNINITLDTTRALPTAPYHNLE